MDSIDLDKDGKLSLGEVCYLIKSIIKEQLKPYKTSTFQMLNKYPLSKEQCH